MDLLQGESTLGGPFGDEPMTSLPCQFWERNPDSASSCLHPYGADEAVSEW